MAASVRIKTVLFSVIENKLNIYLPGQRLPQVLATRGISLNKSAMQVIEKAAKSAISESYLEQLYTFSRPFEELIQVDIVYFLLLPAEKISEYDQESWVKADQISKNSSEFGIISYAIQRLRWKAEYTNVVYSLLGTEFTLSELQMIYEAILGKKLDKRNFRRKNSG